MKHSYVFVSSGAVNRLINHDFKIQGFKKCDKLL